MQEGLAWCSGAPRPGEPGEQAAAVDLAHEGFPRLGEGGGGAAAGVGRALGGPSPSPTLRAPAGASYTHAQGRVRSRPGPGEMRDAATSRGSFQSRDALP